MDGSRQPDRLAVDAEPYRETGSGHHAQGHRGNQRRAPALPVQFPCRWFTSVGPVQVRHAQGHLEWCKRHSDGVSDRRQVRANPSSAGCLRSSGRFFRDPTITLQLPRDAHFLGGPWAPALKRAWHKTQAWFTSSSCFVKPSVSLAAARVASRAVAAA